MSEDRFNAFLLLYVHSDIKLDYKKIINMHATRYPRRMVLKNPLTEQWLMKKVSLHSKGLWSFWSFRRFFTNVEYRGNEVDYVYIYVKT